MTSLQNHQQLSSGSKLFKAYPMKEIYLFSTSSHPDATTINSLSIKFFQPSSKLEAYDYLILTSKQVSEVFKYFHIKPTTPAIAVSTKTAQAYESIGGKVVAVGSGYGDNLERIIKEYPKTTSWLYLRAKVVASDFVMRCREDGFKVDEEIIYESFCSKEILEAKVKDDAILIFTSPSSVECFLKTHRISQSNIVIVIGKTTAKMLPKYVKYTQSDKTTIENCIDLALSYGRK